MLILSLIHIYRQKSEESVGYHVIPVIEDLEDDFSKLQKSTWTFGTKEADAWKAQVEDVFGDILPVQVQTPPPYAVLTQWLLRYMSMETMMFSIYDYPELVHEMIDVYKRQAMERAVRALPLETLSGVILTHGTDTLAYSAAALSLLLSDVSIPVLLVSSHYPLEDARQNGRQNFRAAVDFIKQAGVPGVYAPICQQGETAYYEGGTLRKAQGLTHVFRSVAGPFGRWENGTVLLKGTAKAPSAPAFGPNPKASGEILTILPHPGLDYRHFDLEYHPPKACLLYTSRCV